MIGDFTFKVACSTELGDVLDLRATVYSEDLGQVPQDDLDECATHLIAVSHAGDVVAAFRVLGPDLRPFDFEQYAASSQLIPALARPALLGRLCVHRQYRQIRPNIQLHIGLLRLALRHAKNQGFTHLYLYTYDNLRAFYRAALFSDTQILFPHPTWGTVRLMCLEVQAVNQAHQHSRRKFLNLIFDSDNSD